MVLDATDSEGQGDEESSWHGVHPDNRRRLYYVARGMGAPWALESESPDPLADITPNASPLPDLLTPPPPLVSTTPLTPPLDT